MFSPHVLHLQVPLCLWRVANLLMHSRGSWGRHVLRISFFLPGLSNYQPRLLRCVVRLRYEDLVQPNQFLRPGVYCHAVFEHFHPCLPRLVRLSEVIVQDSPYLHLSVFRESPRRDPQQTWLFLPQPFGLLICALLRQLVRLPCVHFHFACFRLSFCLLLFVFFVIRGTRCALFYM